MTDSWKPNDDSHAMPDDAKQILRELESRIILMEAALGSLHQSEASTGVKRTADKVDLRKKLTVCYVARDSMRRGHHHKVGTLTRLLLRIQMQIDHKSFVKLGPVTPSLFKGIDVGALGRRLAATGS